LPALLLMTATAWAQDSWRSDLYPETWTPDHADAKGRSLQDFSWAGYRHGSTPPVMRQRVVRVKLAGTADATATIQAAIDKVALNDASSSKGGVVLIPAGTWRIDGRLRVEASHTVIRGEGPNRTRLLFTKDSGLNGAAHLTVTGRLRRTGNWLLAVPGRVGDTSVRLQTTDGLSAGDPIGIGLVITGEFRADHGMSKYWRFAAGKWRALFLRVVTRVDADKHTVHFRVPLRYPLLRKYGASVRKEDGYITECGIEHLSVCNAVAPDAAWRQTRTHAIELRDAVNCWVRNVHSFACPREDIETDGAHLMSGGIRVRNSRCVTVMNCEMAMAQHRGGGGNGYLFEIRQSNEVLTLDCKARRGRHNFIQNWDFGTAGCVWLRCLSRDGHALFSRNPPLGIVGTSEYHHSLSMGCLVDSCTIDDGWQANNRGGESSGAGHTATQCVFWNCAGRGFIRSAQFGIGYVIGTAPSLSVITATDRRGGQGTNPEDYTDGLGRGTTLKPRSLYEDQRRRRLRAQHK